MTWRHIDNVPVEEVAEFMYLVLSAAVDGMEGVPKEELGTDSVDQYWAGCIETAARMLAFVFSATECSWSKDDGIYISDSVFNLHPNLWAAVQLLTGYAQLAEGLHKEDFIDYRIDDAAERWAKTWLEPEYGERLVSIMRRNTEKRTFRRIEYRAKQVKGRDKSDPW